MVEEGVVDHAEDGNALVDQTQRYARVGEAMYKVGRPVNGVYAERRGIREGWAGSRRVGLFADELEMRIYARDLPPDKFLDLHVVLRDEIDRVLLLAYTSCARALDSV